ncbi:MAG: 7-cyano-7-deazaguanine synthase QueC [Legionella sp.]|jgi:7-cyano-7-deazaguanine synthase|nr:7-cyano-7-deazaguanine synthase QueC [Legionella sp.]
MKKAVILFSGGLDSTTCLAIAQSEGYDCYALSFDYAQHHLPELNAAKAIAKHLGVHHTILTLPNVGGSALTDERINVPDYQQENAVDHIPVTYVPARNTIFLSYAMAYAEVIAADAIFIGVSAVDYSGYPDCRPEFIAAFQTLAHVATKSGVEHHAPEIKTPLIHLSKAETIQRGHALGVDYSQTVSCYQANAKGEACGRCDSCALRKKGFNDIKLPDETRYTIQHD